MTTAPEALTVEVTVSRSSPPFLRLWFQLPKRTSLVANGNWGRPWDLADFKKFHCRQIWLFVSIWAHWPMMNPWEQVRHILLKISEVDDQFRFEFVLKLRYTEEISPEDITFILEAIQRYLRNELLREVTVVKKPLRPTDCHLL